MTTDTSRQNIVRVLRDEINGYRESATAYRARARELNTLVDALESSPSSDTRETNWRHDLLIQAAWPTFDKEIGGTHYGLISKRDLEMICDRAATRGSGLPPEMDEGA